MLVHTNTTHDNNQSVTNPKTMSAPNGNANNDAYLLNAFQQQQQQFQQLQQLQQGIHAGVDHSKSQPVSDHSSSHSNLIVDNNASSFLTTSIPTNTNTNMNPLGQQQQQQQLGGSSSSVTNISHQQLLELMAAVSNARQTGVDSNNVTTVTVTMPTDTATALLQQQFLTQQQQAQPTQNNNASMNTQAQLATLLQTQQPLAQNNLQQQQQQQPLAQSNLQQQQQQQPLAQSNLQQQQQQQTQRQHSLSLGNLQQIQQAQQPQQRQHSLSLGNLNTLQQQQQQQQQQQLLLGGLANATNNNRSSANANSTFVAMPQLGHQQVLANTKLITPLSTTRKVTTSNTKSATTSKTKQFLLFIKILLKCLDATSNNILKERAKAIVGECTKRNRLGDPNYQPLQQAVEQRLRPVVGEQWWTRAQTYAQTYQTKQPQLKQRVALVRQQQQLARQQQQQFAMRNPVMTRL